MTIQQGDPVDFAPSGSLRHWTGTTAAEVDGKDVDLPIGPGFDPASKQWRVGVEWDEPREIVRIAVRYKAGTAPDPARVAVEWWRMAAQRAGNWPYPRKDSQYGARRGWRGADDPFQGAWTTAFHDAEAHGDEHFYAFRHLEYPEIEDLAALDAMDPPHCPWRRALKFALRFVDGEGPIIEEIKVFGVHRWQEAAATLWLGMDAKGKSTLRGDWSGRLEAWNAHIAGVEPVGFDGEDAMQAGGSWRCHVGEKPKGIRIRLLHTGVGGVDPASSLVGFVRGGGRNEEHAGEPPAPPMGGGRSCARVADILAGPVVVPAHGIVWTSAVDDLPSPIEIRGRLDKQIFDKIGDGPEQTLTRAMAETPRMKKVLQPPEYGAYMVLGCEGARQEFSLRHNGNIWLSKTAARIRGRDLLETRWPGREIFFDFGSGDPPDFREREDGFEMRPLEPHLPAFEARWTANEIEYVETAFASLLDRPLGEPMDCRGDEPAVCHVRFTIRNVETTPRRARLWLRIGPHERLRLDDGLLIADGRIVQTDIRTSLALVSDSLRRPIPETYQWNFEAYPRPCVRMAMSIPEGARASLRPCAGREAEAAGSENTAVQLEWELGAGDTTHLDLAIPFITPAPDRARARLMRCGFDDAMDNMRSYWSAYRDQSIRIAIPDAPIAALADSVLTHVAITADRDPKSGLYNLPAATMGYGACGNEASLQTRQLDFRGLHRFAQACLDTFIAIQGKTLPNGRFKSAEGALQGMEVYDGEPHGRAFGYNLDHGFMLTALAEHFLLARDRDWLADRGAASMIAACDFVTRERQGTMVKERGGRSPAWGLLPAGHEEDHKEWRHWFAVNAHAHLGMKRVARVLREEGHPEAERIAGDTAAYCEDIRTAARLACEISPVEKCLDGIYIPHVPPRSHVRGLDWGWIREGAYGALHLVEGEVWEATEPAADWTLRFLEDCVFVTRDMGRPVDLERFWFSQGGTTIQANLLGTIAAYVKTDRIEHAVRAFYNNFAVQAYPDLLAFAEYVGVAFGHGSGPFYKTPDECGFLNSLRQMMILEEGEDLWLLRGAPHCWFEAGKEIRLEGAPTWYGPMSLRVNSERERINVELESPSRNPASHIFLRLRPPAGTRLAEVVVNGKSITAEGETFALGGAGGKLEIKADLALSP